MNYVLGVIIAGLLAVAGFLWWQNSDMENDLVNARKDLSAAEGREKQWKGTAENCSAQVINLESKAKERAAEAAPQQVQAKEQTKVVVRTVTEYIQAPRPAGLDACQSAEQEINNAILANPLR